LEIECRAMAGPERYDAFSLMRRFRTDEAALGDALTLFVEREDYGFVWLAYAGSTCVGCVSVGYAIGTTAGGLIATLDDLYVIPDGRRRGIATTMLDDLHVRLDALDVRRVDIAAPGDPALQAFLRSRGYSSAGDVRFTFRA
jgi:GNAT superfamily N-acetyltransferase